MERALPRRGQKCYTEPKPSRRQRAPGDQEELMLTFNHFNFNVADLDKSLAFYKEALGLEPVGERKAAAGSEKSQTTAASSSSTWGMERRTSAWN